MDKTIKEESKDPQTGNKTGTKTCYLFGLAGAIGATLFLLIIFALDIIQPGHNPVLKTISELVYGSYGWLQTLAFIILGIFFFAFVLRLYSMTTKKASSVTGASFFGITSIGFFLIAAFPAQVDALEVTSQGVIHNSIAGLISASFIIGCITFAHHFRTDPHWKRYWFYTVLTVIFCIGFAILWALIPEGWELRGLSERLLLFSGLVWVSVVSLKMVRICIKTRRETDTTLT